MIFEIIVGISVIIIALTSLGTYSIFSQADVEYNNRKCKCNNKCKGGKRK